MRVLACPRNICEKVLISFADIEAIPYEPFDYNKKFLRFTRLRWTPMAQSPSKFGVFKQQSGTIVHIVS